jgi:hypothetical protein
VTQLSLLFGSTWVVNTSVFGGIAFAIPVFFAKAIGLLALAIYLGSLQVATRRPAQAQSTP